MASADFMGVDPFDGIGSEHAVDYHVHRDAAFACLARASGSEGAAHIEDIIEGLQNLRDTCRAFVDQKLLSGPLGRPRPTVRAEDLPELLVCSPLLKDMSALVEDVSELIDAAAASELPGSEEWPPEEEELASSLQWFQEIECRWRLEMEGLEALGLGDGRPSGQ